LAVLVFRAKAAADLEAAQRLERERVHARSMLIATLDQIGDETALDCEDLISVLVDDDRTPADVLLGE
jgi:hypothetical protein